MKERDATLLFPYCFLKENKILSLSQMIKEGGDICRPERVPTGDFSMRGFLVLARSHENCSGLLMAEEVKGHGLKAEVAVLSCCQTGKGQVTGEFALLLDFVDRCHG